MRMLPPSSLTVPDVQISRVRFFMEELCSRRCSDGRSGRSAEGDALGAQRTGFWRTDPYGPVATAISARSSRPDGRTSLFVESCPLCVVGIVAPHHRGQMGVLVGDGLMPVHPTPSRNRRQRSGVTVLCRYLSHHILTCPRPTPYVGEAEEGERGTIRFRMVSPIWSVVAEIDEPRLVGMECESIPCKALTQDA